MYNVIRAYGQLYHTEYSRVDGDGIYIEFHPALQTFVPTYTWEDMRMDWYEWNIDILGVDYKLVSLNSSDSSVSLARESSSPCQVNESVFLRVGEEIGCSDGSFYRMIYDKNEEKPIHLEDRLHLKDGENGVELIWDYQKTTNPELKSIFISSDSDTYEEIEEQGQESIVFSETFAVYDAYAGLTYDMNETINDSGLYLEFYPPLSVCNLCCDSCYTPHDYVDEWHLTENHAIEIPVLDDVFLLSCLELNSTGGNSKACLAKEEEHVPLNPVDCTTNLDRTNHSYISILGKLYAFYQLNYAGEVIICELSDAISENHTCEKYFSPIQEGNEIMLPYGSILHLWKAAPGYTRCAQWIEVSHFSNIVELENGLDDVELTWSNKTFGREKEITEIVNGTVLHRIGREEYDIPGLKSIYISANSTAYQRLT